MKNNELQRRYRLDKCLPIEKKLYQVVLEIEKMGSDVTLTTSINLIHEARNLISDFIDKTNI